MIQVEALQNISYIACQFKLHHAEKQKVLQLVQSLCSLCRHNNELLAYASEIVCVLSDFVEQKALEQYMACCLSSENRFYFNVYSALPLIFPKLSQMQISSLFQFAQRSNERASNDRSFARAFDVMRLLVPVLRLEEVLFLADIAFEKYNNPPNEVVFKHQVIQHKALEVIETILRYDRISLFAKERINELNEMIRCKNHNNVACEIVLATCKLIKALLERGSDLDISSCLDVARSTKYLRRPEVLGTLLFLFPKLNINDSNRVLSDLFHDCNAGFPGKIIEQLLSLTVLECRMKVNLLQRTLSFLSNGSSSLPIKPVEVIAELSAATVRFFLDPDNHIYSPLLVKELDCSNLPEPIIMLQRTQKKLAFFGAPIMPQTSNGMVLQDGDLSFISDKYKSSHFQ